MTATLGKLFYWSDSLLTCYPCRRLVVIPVKRLLPIACALLLLGLSMHLVSPNHPLIPSVRGSNRTISLVGYYPSGWNSSQPSGSNPTITVTQGDTVTMQLSSGDSLPHRFLVDFDNDVNPADTTECPATDPCSGTFATSTITSYTCTVSSTITPGNDKYICVIHYPYMVGTFVVQAAPTPDFTMASNPSSMTFLQGSSGTATITVTSINGFSGPVNLAATVSPAGPTPSLSPTSVMVPSATSATSTLTVSTTSSTSSGTYTVTVKGTSGSTSHTTTITVVVNAPASQDFTIAASSPATVNATQSGTSTITITPLNGFNGIVTLVDSVPAGLTCGVITPSSVTGSGTATVSCSANAAGTFTLTATGTSGSLVHTATASFNFVDFTLSLSPGSLNITQGSTASSTITLTSLNGFSGVLSLTGTVSPSGPTVSFNPTSVSLTAGGTGNSMMTVSTVAGYYSSIATGNYLINVTATNGSLPHSKTVAVSVNSPTSTTPPPFGVGSLPVAVLIGVGVAIAAAVGVVVYLVRRKPVVG